MRMSWYLRLTGTKTCCSSGRGQERATAVITASFSSSESTGPLVSRSSIKGALASIAASVTGMEISWFDSGGVWCLGVDWREYCGEEKWVKRFVGEESVRL